MAEQKKKIIKKPSSSEPHNSDAERAVLGCAILAENALYNVLASLREEDFYEGKHQIIFRAIQALQSKHTKVDILTLAEELENLRELSNIGGTDYLRQCTDSVATVSSVEFYINIVNDQAVLRKMLKTIREIDKSYMENEIENVNDFILTSENEFKDSIARRKVSNFKPVEEVADVVSQQIEKLIATRADEDINDDEKDLIGLNTGFARINKLTQGFKPSELIIVAARPSVGKTALSLNFALNVAKYHRNTVAIFELEMDSEMLVKRLVASASCVPLKQIISGRLTPNERMRVSSAIREVSQQKIFIDDSSGLNLIDIVAKAKKLQITNKDLGLIIVDYIGLVQYGGKSNAKNNDSRQEEVRKISLALKDLARQLKVPVIAVSQLSRKVDERDSKKPELSDLRDSGSIEQDADIVMLLYREDYYNSSKKDKKSAKYQKKTGAELNDEEKRKLADEQKHDSLAKSVPSNASYVEVSIKKNRNGETGIAGLFFYKEYGRFDSVSKEYEEMLAKLSEDNN